MTQNGSGPDRSENAFYQAWADSPMNKERVPQPTDPIEFPDRIRFMLHTGPNSAIEGWAEFESDRLSAYLTDKDARSLGDLVRQGARIKAHMYFEIEPDREKS